VTIRPGPHVNPADPRGDLLADTTGRHIEIYLVQGIRKGYLDFQVERDNNLPK
jgi:hypothetical protein